MVADRDGGGEFSRKGKPVSFSPRDAVCDTEQDKLIDMTCEQVIDYKVKEELQRTEHMPFDEDCEVRVFFRSVPSGLLVALNTLANYKSRGRFVVMKCLAHHGLALLSTLDGVKESNKQYCDIMELNGRCGGLTDLIEEIDIQHYAHSNSRGKRGEFRAAQVLVSAYCSYAKGLSISPSSLMAVCYAWSLTTSTDTAVSGVIDALRPEVEYFKRYACERVVFMEAYWKIAQMRLDTVSGRTFVQIDDCT
jgi:hypothetical protein